MHRSSRNCEKECNFFTNPTLLSRLILLRHYAAAIRRVCSPEGNREASVWCCAKRPDSNDYHIRQLPIHMAARALSRDATHPDLLRLLQQLVVAYPAGCQHADHQGRYPLHETIWYGASLEVISSLLIAAPTIGHQADLYSRYPYELNERRPPKNTDKDEEYRRKVRGLLEKPTEHWKAAYQEYRFRMKQRYVPDDDASIQSTTPLSSDTMFLSAVGDDESTMATLQTAPKGVDDYHEQIRSGLQQEQQYWARVKQQYKDQTEGNATNASVVSNDSDTVSSLSSAVLRSGKADYHKPVEPMEWKQIERRTLDLEDELAHALEQNYTQAAIIAELRGGREEQVSQVSVLQDEIRKLHQTITLLEKRPKAAFSGFLANLEWMNDWRKENEDLKDENERLQADNQDLQLRIAYFEKVLDGLSLDSMSSVAPSEQVVPSVDDSSMRTELDEDESLASPVAGTRGTRDRFTTSETRQSWAIDDVETDLFAIPEGGSQRKEDDEGNLSENFTDLLNETARKYGVL